MDRRVVSRIESRSMNPPISAYDYYLQGREHYRQYRRVENEQAIELFRKSVEVDPLFALGHAELANALVIQQGNFGVPGNWVAQAIGICPAGARAAARST